MGDDAHGYDLSESYGYGFGREMAPDWIDFSARLAGQRAPRQGASFDYLELGCGQGQGLCVMAAASPAARFVGIDLHPGHVAHARRMAAEAGLSNVRFVEGDIVALAEAWPGDLGTFDYVVAHGLYSWISPAVRAAVVRCLSHATREGALVYNGYNTMPGWLGTMPFQHITRMIRQTGGKDARGVFDASVALFDRLRAGGAETFRILPGLAGRLDAVKTRPLGYLSGEYLHDHWHPLWHSTVARELAGAGLRYVGPATLAEALLPAQLPPALRATILEQDDPALRQDLQDLVINQFFRRDIYVRGEPNPGTPVEDTAVVLATVQPPEQPIRFDTAFAQVMLQPPSFAEILTSLESGPRSIAQLAALPGMARQGIEATRAVVLLLLHAGTLAVAPDVSGDAAVASRINAAVARGAAQGMAYEHLAAATLASGIATGEIELLLLDAWLEGARDAATLAAGATKRLAALGRGPLPAGAAETFVAHTLPHWRALGVLAWPHAAAPSHAVE